MPEFAVDTALRLAYKMSTSGWGAAPGTGSAKILRRVSSNFNLIKAALASREKKSNYQRSDSRHGLGQVTGTISGELSALTYQDFWSALCRQTFQTAATTGALTNVTAAATSPQFVRAAGSFITDGFKKWDIVRWTGFAGGSAPNNNSRNFLITALTATDMTGVFLDASAVVADTAGDTVTCTLVGKKTWVPQTGHIDPHFDVEHWHADIAQSELYLGCKLDSAAVGIDSSRLVSIDMAFKGKDIQTATSAYYSSPSAETDSGLLSPASGYIYEGGTQIGYLTGMSFTINANMMVADKVVGATRPPAILEGDVIGSGQVSAYFQDGALRDKFFNETELSLVGAYLDSNAATADFLNFVFGRCKLYGAGKNDGAGGYIQTFPFEILENVDGGTATTLADLKTTLSIQDSLAA